MNKKIIASALLVFGAFTSLNAAAAITYGNSTDVGANVQGADAVAAAGGAAVRANDITLYTTAAGDIKIKGTGETGEIVLRLPKGVNFEGAPKYAVTPRTPTLGLTLKDSAGDPTTTDPEVVLTDANGDGGMDRAVITVARNSGADSTAGDTLTISVNVKVDAGVTAGVKKASIILNGGIATTDLINVVKDFTSPLNVTALTAADIRSQSAQTLTITSKPFIVTIPKGTKGGSKLTFKPSTGVKFSDGLNNNTQTSTLTATVLTPALQTPYTAASLSAATAGANSATVSIELVVTGTTTYTLPEDSQVQLAISAVQLLASTTTGARGLEMSGVLAGSIPLANVAKGGSAATLVTGTGTVTPPVIVAGGSAKQTLPSITVTENFVGDAVTVGGTATITFTPSAGLTLAATTPTLNAGWSWGSPTVSTAGVLTLVVLHDAGSATKTLTITGLQATATKTAAGSLTVTVAGSQTNAPNKDVLTVASAVALGTVDVSLDTATKAKATGQGAGGTHNVLLKETTYGAITTAAASTDPVNPVNALLTFDPGSNAKISGITLTMVGYPGTTNSPTISACVAPATGKTLWTCKVTAESSKIEAGTSTVKAAIDWVTNNDAAIGSDVVITAGGNVGVSGAVTVGTVGLNTKAVSGAIPDLKPGSLTAADIATVTITELFTNAVTSTVGSSFRLFAPAGVAFQDAGAIQASSTTVGTATISSTFNPNDTLTLTRVATATITFTAKVIVADGNSGLQSFELVDGDINGKNLSNISPATLNLAYADGTLEALSAGKAAAVNIGFSASNTVEGGLAPYTVASSATPTVSAAIDGSTVTATGVAAGAATITVTDALGATSTYVVTVSAGAAEPEQGKATKASDGSTSAATFTGGATTDGGTTYTSAITTTDDVIINATINVDPEDVGEAGGIHAVVLSPAGFLMLESDGSWVPWDGKITSIATYLEVEALAATYSVPLYNGTIATAGKWRFAVIYSTDAGKLVYTTKAAVITVSE